MPEGHEQHPMQRPETPPAPLLGRGSVAALLVWGLAILAVTAGIAGETAFWPLVPFFGAALPALLVVLRHRDNTAALRERLTQPLPAPGDLAEQRVIEALDEAGELTAVGVAARTNLSVARASEVLDHLVVGGHLEVNFREGTLAYALREGDRREPQATCPDTAQEGGAPQGVAEEPGARPGPLEDPLSEREREVLGLLASGKTNREVAEKLYVSPGTVKAHVASIYRKLDVHNRAQMLNEARALGLLGPSP
jgi:ATP/maltotriose-dependent transcriptional regulator MalT